MAVFQTAKLWRGVQMFRATRLSADTRQITTILQQVLSSEPRSTTNAKRAADRKLTGDHDLDQELRTRQIGSDAGARTGSRVNPGVPHRVHVGDVRR
jgi:hypothetical protein